MAVEKGEAKQLALGTGGRWERPETPPWELSDISVLWRQWESSPTPHLYPSVVGQLSPGDTEVGMGQCRRLWGWPGCRQFPAPLSLGKAWPFPRPSWNAGLLGVEQKCDFPFGV